jgi:hypothetical protein
VVVTDGYEVYHSLERKRDDLRIAGCWIHAKRKFAEYVKALGTASTEGTLSGKAVRLISQLFHLDNKLDGLPDEERLKQRQLVLKPKVDAFFEWVKVSLPKVPGDSDTARAFRYCLNQESYLRVFLSDPHVPLHNNIAEQAIRPFTLGRKNWVNMYSTRGAQASAVIYSLVETAKANNLNVYEYFDYLLTQLSSHAEDTDLSFLCCSHGRKQHRKNAAAARKPDSFFKVLKICETAANTAVFSIIHTCVLYSCLSVYDRSKNHNGYSLP